MSSLELRLKEQKEFPFLGVFPVATRERKSCKRLRLLSRSLKVLDGPLLPIILSREKNIRETIRSRYSRGETTVCSRLLDYWAFCFREHHDLLF